MASNRQKNLDDAWLRAGDLLDLLDIRDPLIAKVCPEFPAGLLEIRRLIGEVLETVPAPPTIVRLAQYRPVCSPRLAPQPPKGAA